MSNQADARKWERLFNLLLANFTAFSPQHRDIFVCPLCGRGFDRAALQMEGVLTLEHCVSGKLGGEEETLTCGACINTQGSNLDSHVVNRFKRENSLMGLRGESLKVKLDVAAHVIQARLLMNQDDHIEITFVEKATPPDQFKGAMKVIEEKGRIPDGLQFGVSGSMNFTRRGYEVGLLRSAFLVLFNSS